MLRELIGKIIDYLNSGKCHKCKITIRPHWHYELPDGTTLCRNCYYDRRGWEK